MNLPLIQASLKQKTAPSYYYLREYGSLPLIYALSPLNILLIERRHLFGFFLLLVSLLHHKRTPQAQTYLNPLFESTYYITKNQGIKYLRF